MKKFYKKKRFWFNLLVAVVALGASMTEVIREIDSSLTPFIILGLSVSNVVLSLISKELSQDGSNEQ